MRERAHGIPTSPSPASSIRVLMRVQGAQIVQDTQCASANMVRGTENLPENVIDAAERRARITTIVQHSVDVGHTSRSAWH